ncbi:type I glyceraldehyde-3-phosphate dehydrogenase [Lawsonia intracellularis]|uniref:Glyceraldehyde-3-phosphate dehydrogenase n=1 Tax=Lawsonia intracellularis (strain PHE/MN1-00) TaxID=363253 RepID=Q1MPA4_LAWIP|nr:type I glyceraldehyde-3-phosphate dehydrogenase [Lawsonia intracellularis]AGC50556.1 glyceraldehyde-3-phosphate dehydrogenase, type I [Lawsonia intracellularis N343]KAA0204572.1 type I glyceraldehyde-3-phosphate dehydrogenase [Lawsonia intracellularis]MBZ3893007.1 type I glyceraldehyde-3-phosphate dehydrogenase [Lawsonia intracellularis]OMQ02360.1 type I glyceraldehyde-3-phosphate dehydrogenase [Lawsonia intracellularis]RBN32842.1 type I glyceraldehyde-3-phosphate dehydrogenase [Lawsonia in
MSKTRIAINGFGRIGRQTFKAIYTMYKEQLEVVAVNDLYDTNTNFHLLEYDTNYGRANLNANINGNTVIIGDWTIQCLAEKDPTNLPWASLGVDIVIESTGIFKTADQARVHLNNGAKKVIITAPTKGEDIMIVMGVNQDMYDPTKDNIISNASCTTNCLAPIALVLEKHFGIESGTMTTVHSYTNDQRILDLPHKDLRRARAAACNIIPTSTGAAQAVAKVIPELKGKFTGWSLRVPTPTVSIVDFTAILKKNSDTETIRKALEEASNTYLKGIMAYNRTPLVSMDFKGDSHSSIVEEEYTIVQTDNLAKVISWYDNEWGYSCRVADLSNFLRTKGL